MLEHIIPVTRGSLLQNTPRNIVTASNAQTRYFRCLDSECSVEMDCVFMRNSVVVIKEIIWLVPNDRMDYVVPVCFEYISTFISMVYLCNIARYVPVNLKKYRHPD